MNVCIVFKLTLVSFFTEMNFIQNKAKNIISKKDVIEQFFAKFQNTWPKIAKVTYKTLQHICIYIGFKYISNIYLLCSTSPSSPSFNNALCLPLIIFQTKFTYWNWNENKKKAFYPNSNQTRATNVGVLN